MKSFPVKMSWPLIILLIVLAKVFVSEKFLTPSALGLGMLVLIYLAFQWAWSAERVRTNKLHVSIYQPLFIALVVAGISLMLWVHLFTVSNWVLWERVLKAPVALWTIDTWLLMFQGLYQNRIEHELGLKSDSSDSNQSD